MSVVQRQTACVWAISDLFKWFAWKCLELVTSQAAIAFLLSFQLLSYATLRLQGSFTRNYKPYPLLPVSIANGNVMNLLAGLYLHIICSEYRFVPNINIFPYNEHWASWILYCNLFGSMSTFEWLHFGHSFASACFLSLVHCLCYEDNLFNSFYFILHYIVTVISFERFYL